MNISKYQIFVMTVECGSFSKAAEMYHFTQPGISHAIQSLEEELGVVLLSRNRSGVALTADGRALLPKIRRLCADYHQLEQFTEDLKGLNSGFVKVATFSSVSAQWLPSILKEFGEMYPNIEFEILSSDYYSQIEEWIVSGEADCGFLRIPSVQTLQVYPLYEEEMKAITSMDFSGGTEDGFITTEELQREPFIQEGKDEEMMLALNELSISPNVRYTTLDDRSILAMVSKGLGISLLPSLVLQNSPYPIKEYRLPMEIHREIGIAVKDKKMLSQSTIRFVDFVRHWVKDNTFSQL